MFAIGKFFDITALLPKSEFFFVKYIKRKIVSLGNKWKFIRLIIKFFVFFFNFK